ncbi:MAG: acetyltransferase [Planctomycetota bacterium]|nr:MAG: acetyltransferase [Planctomycetota bacterium]
MMHAAGFDLPTRPLTSEHVELQLFADEHREPLHAASLPGDTFRFMPMAAERPDDWARGFERMRDMPANAAGGIWAVRHRACGEWIGASGFLVPSVEHRRVEIGFSWVAASHRGQGVNPAVKRLLLALAFDTLGCERVEFKTDARNAHSRAALARLGAHEEGTFRHHLLMPDGAWRDSVYYSILRDEWPAVRDTLDARLAKRDPSHCGALRT